MLTASLLEKSSETR